MAETASSPRTRQTNRGLRKYCECRRREWAKCSHPWQFNYRHVRKSLDKLVGRPITSKTEAEAEANRLRVAIDAGTLARPASEAPSALPTFKVVSGLFVEGYVKLKRRPRAVEQIRYIDNFLDGVLVPGTDGQPIAFTAKPFARITADDIERVIAAKAKRVEVTVAPAKLGKYPRRVGGPIAANRLFAHLRKLWNWGVRKDYLDRSPFAKVDVARHAERKRTRRLEGDEAERLRAAAGDDLRDLIDAALETGCRVGELLSLQWSQVRWLRNEIFLPGEKTKTNRDRAVPISAALRLILVRRQNDPAGEPHKPAAFVFGTATGESVVSIKYAWRVACRCAKIADLRFHDLRHEAGSRKADAGWPFHAVSAWLGHTSLKTTERYLNLTARQLHELNERPVVAAVR